MSQVQAQERLAEIWTRVVGDLRQTIKDLQITQDELHVAAEYLKRVADAEVMRSLIDAALSMASMDATRGGTAATRSNPEGPYFYGDAPLRPDGNLLDREPSAQAERLRVRGRVMDAKTRQALSGATVHVWQADEDGNYDLTGYHLRGQVKADEEGNYEFSSVVPSDYEEHDNDPIGELYHAMGRTNYRAAHIHLKVTYKGVDVLTTQMYMPDAEYFDSDYVEGAVSPDLTLHRSAAADGVSEGNFDLYVTVSES